MAKQRSQPPPTPACYAMVLPGLEEVAGEELTDDFGAEVKRSGHGVVVFRMPEVDAGLLRLRLTEDIFLLAWGTDELTYRALDLKSIERWTARDANWPNLLRLHHGIRPKPAGKPTYRLVTQMTGQHGYRRVDAAKALAKGLAGKLPASWRPAEENASVEIWLTIHGKTAVCGVRLSDHTMRHRKYKQEHIPASLRPTVAAAMVRLAGARPGESVLDPMCGAGTILAEQLAVLRGYIKDRVMVLGGDLEWEALRDTRANLRGFDEVPLCRWDATQLPLAGVSIDRIISNPPFGKQLGDPAEIGRMYRRMIVEYDRVLRPGGSAVLLVADQTALREAAQRLHWKPGRKLQVRVLGQWATMSSWSKAKER
jgi:23S rRNA G2445 N2-methylase RlmL